MTGRFIYERHVCKQPDAKTTTTRSVWECDCGQQWTLAPEHFEPIGIFGGEMISPYWEILHPGEFVDGEYTEQWQVRKNEEYAAKTEMREMMRKSQQQLLELKADIANAKSPSFFRTLFRGN